VYATIILETCQENGGEEMSKTVSMVQFSTFAQRSSSGRIHTPFRCSQIEED